jgi:HK97 family phage portal protein
VNALARSGTRAVTPTVRVPSRTLEIRDPSAATAALQFSSPGHPQISEWDANAAIKLAYLSNVFVYRCVEVIAKSLGGLPFRMGADPAKPNDYDRQHPLAKLLGPAPGGPAPKISARQLWSWSAAQRLVTGKLGWEIERGAKDQPIAFWPLASSSLDAVPSKGGTDYFAEFRYGRPSEKRTLTKDQVFYHWNPSLTDWRQPESVLQAARLDVSVAVMQDRYDFAFLRNDARPASVVVHQAFAERDERDSWREKFLGEHMGPDNAGRVGFVEVDADEGQPVTGMIDIKTLGLSQRDAEFINRYNSKIRGITVAFGTPLSVLGDASGRTFSNADAEDRFFWAITMLNMVREVEDAVNVELAPMFNGGSSVGWFDLTKVRALEPIKKPPTIDLVKATVEGIFSDDEVRAETLGLGPKPNGTGAVAKPKPPQAPPSSPPRLRPLPPPPGPASPRQRRRQPRSYARWVSPRRPPRRLRSVTSSAGRSSTAA